MHRRWLSALILPVVALGGACSTADDHGTSGPTTTGGRAQDAAGTSLPYEADDGPGEVGEELPLDELGITGGSGLAVKLGRRTYRIPEEGGSTTVVIAPTRWRDADDRTAAAATAPSVASCDELATTDARAADEALAGVGLDDLEALPLVDRQYAVSERLLPMFAASRAYVAANPCDLVSVATSLLDRLRPGTREVVERALTPLDLTGREPAEAPVAFPPELLAGLLQPVER